LEDILMNDSMSGLSSLQKAWALLDVQERRNAWLVLGVIIIAALASAVMVGSVMPFLAVMADSSRIETTPILTWAFDIFGFSSVYGFLVGLGIASFAVIIVSSLIQIAKTWAVAQFSMMRIHSISYGLLSSYLAQPYVFFLNRHSGEMGSRVLTESEQVVLRFLNPAAELIAASLTTLAIISLLLWVNPTVTLASFVVVGGSYILVFRLIRSNLKELGRTRVAANHQRFRLSNEALTGIKDIKLFGRENAYLDRYMVPSILMAQAQSKITILSSVPQFALQAITFGGIILLCLLLIDPEGISSGKTLSGILPTLGVFAFAGQRLMPELSKLYNSLALIQAGSAAVDSVYDDFVLKKGSSKRPDPVPAAMGLKMGLQLENVCFSYSNTDYVGVRNVSLSIAAGEKIGIVGTTGAGKTTLADVVLGLLEPDHGRLVVDGTDITSENLRAWMNSVGYVPQDIFLTDAPLAENIALGEAPEHIDYDRIHNAARIARIDRFIEDELPEGYQTHIGERGVRLSGGQRQRIGIARALYHDADLIVFDEATSALDNLTEAEVMEAIDALPGDKTVLIIAHRLSTVRSCDRIVVLDRGRVVGYDSWSDLLTKNEAFQRIAHGGSA
jgi:ABC-type multidrug transport system fused ATPase/permease subunit